MTEYRVHWKRLGLKPKSRRYASLKVARRFMLLFGPEPWRAYAPESHGDDLVCCRGSRDCACGGVTYAERAATERENMPAIEWVRIEGREVGEWAEVLLEVGVNG